MRAILAVMVAALLAVFVAACDLVEGDSVTASATGGPLPKLVVVVDTDMLPDDWLALLYLASEPTVEIRAVTVAGGSVVGCADGVAIARDLLAGVGKIAVPVACGPSPSPGGRPFPPEWAEETRSAAAGIGWTGADGDPAGAPILEQDAVALLRASVDRGPLTVVSLGPPTNLARLLDDPSWDRSAIARVVQMAGAVDVPGDVEGLHAVEWNAAVDPDALATVLGSGVEVVLVSLDGTRFVPVRTKDIDRMTADRSTPAAALAAKVLDSQRPFAEAGGYYLWDVLAAVTARRPDVVRADSIPLRVSLDSAEAGRTVRDAAGSATQVTIEADAAGFERILLDTLLGRGQ
jgi:inosine-uridine nucleoside N-ribohydrolase